MTTTTLDADTRWMQRGCRDQWDLFDGFTETDRQQAKAICRRCPALALCRQAKAKRTDPLTGVIAGIFYDKGIRQ